MGGPVLQRHRPRQGHLPLGGPRRALRDKLGAATFVATVSRARTATTSSRSSAATATLHVVPNSVDLGRWAARTSGPEPSRRAAVARLVEKKGLDDLVRRLRPAAARGVAAPARDRRGRPAPACSERPRRGSASPAAFLGALPHEQVRRALPARGRVLPAVRRRLDRRSRRPADLGARGDGGRRAGRHHRRQRAGRGRRRRAHRARRARARSRRAGGARSSACSTTPSSPSGSARGGRQHVDDTSRSSAAPRCCARCSRRRHDAARAPACPTPASPTAARRARRCTSRGSPPRWRRPATEVLLRRGRDQRRAGAAAGVTLELLPGPGARARGRAAGRRADGPRGSPMPARDFGADAALRAAALHSTAGTAAAAAAGIPHLVELNAPLPEEAARYRRLDDRTSGASRARGARAADVVFAVSRAARRLRGGARRAPRRGPAERRRTRALPAGAARRRRTARPPCSRARCGRGTASTRSPRRGAARIATPHAWSSSATGPAASGSRRSGAASTGAVSQQRWPSCSRGAQIGLAPYAARAPGYFSPLKLFEYLAAGLASVAADLPGVATS